MLAIGCLTQSRVVDAGQDDGTAELGMMLGRPIT